MGLGATVELHNVADAEGFVAAAVRDLGLVLTFHDREDLEAQGLVIMLDLAAAYTPTHAGKRADWSTFSGYAASLLPKRLLSAWHKQAGHRRTRDAAGRRGWDYRGHESLNQLMDAPAFDARVMVTAWDRFVREPVAVAA